MTVGQANRAGTSWQISDLFEKNFLAMKFVRLLLETLVFWVALFEFTKAIHHMATGFTALIKKLVYTKC